MNRPMEYPFFPVVQNFNNDEVLVSDLEQVLTFFPSEIELDTTSNDFVINNLSLFPHPIIVVSWKVILC